MTWHPPFLLSRVWLRLWSCICATYARRGNHPFWISTTSYFYTTNHQFVLSVFFSDICHVPPGVSPCSPSRLVTVHACLLFLSRLTPCVCVCDWGVSVCLPTSICSVYLCTRMYLYLHPHLGPYLCIRLPRYLHLYPENHLPVPSQPSPVTVPTNHWGTDPKQKTLIHLFTAVDCAIHVHQTGDMQRRERQKERKKDQEIQRERGKVRASERENERESETEREGGRERESLYL